jgi:squalene cyclase
LLFRVQVVNLLVSFYARGADSEQFKRHLARVDDYLWVAEDGMKMQGYNGSQAWDTSFALQAMAQAGPIVQKKHADTIARAYAYLDASQIKTDVPQRELFFRTASKGGWPFSTNDHGWPIADCTSEGIKGTLAVRTMQLNGTVNVLPPATAKNASAFSDGFGAVRGGLIAPERYYGALDVLVALHNDRKSVATVVPFSEDSSAAASVVGLLGGAIGGAWAAVGKLVGSPLRLVDTLLDGSLGWHSFNKQLDQGNTDCLHNSEAPSTAPSVAFNNPPSPWFLDAKEKKEDRKPFTGRGAQWFGQSVAGWLGLHRKATDDGGWATYEEKRGGDWYELLNPAEVWGDLMVDYTYTELTSACVTGLAAFARHFPEHRTKDMQRMIARGTDYVRAQQRPDGSWYGSWAVCFTYGTWFGVEALIAGGQPVPSSKSLKGGKAPTSPYDMAGGDGAAIRRACSFLLSKQRPDGGWGESYLSCLTKEYHHTQQSQVVNTAWALLALIHAQAPEAHAVRRGIDFLISKQALCGDWAQENVSGIFNRTCSITYTAYRNIFPLWALGAYCNSYKHKLAHPVPLLGSNISLYVPGGVTGVKPGSSSSSSSSSDAAATNGGAGAAGAAGTGAKKGGAISRSGNAAAGGAGAGAGPAGTPPTGGTTAINGRKHARRSKSRSAGGPLTKMADLTSADTSSSEDDSESSSSEDEEPQQKKKGGKAAAAAGSGAKKAAASSSASASSSSSSRRGRASSVGRK